MNTVKLCMKIALIAIGVIFILYAIFCTVFFNFNLGNVLPGIYGGALIVFAIFFDKIYTKNCRGFYRFLKYAVTAGVIFICVTFVYLCAMVYTESKSIPKSGKDAVIVLGAGLKGDRVTSTLALRLNKAAEYHNENPDSIIIVSGGQGKDEKISEAAAMRAYLESAGIDSEKILSEDKSTSTKENFIFSKQILDEHFNGENYSVVYVTNDFHLYRAGFYAKKAGLLNAEGLAATSQTYMLPNYYAREYLAVLWYFCFEAAE